MPFKFNKDENVQSSITHHASPKKGQKAWPSYIIKKACPSVNKTQKSILYRDLLCRSRKMSYDF